MSESPEQETAQNGPAALRRCPGCDSVLGAGDERCFMCGLRLDSPTAPEAAEVDPEAASGPGEGDVAAESVDDDAEAEAVVSSLMRERTSPVTFWFTAVFAVIIIVLGALVLRYQDPTVSLALVPSGTPVPPTATNTPTWTPLALESSVEEASPTASPTVAATATPQPPRVHRVNQGETLIGLALRYRVSAESIAVANDMSPDTPIQVDQSLAIPWPTPTPPLVAIAVTVRGVNVIADPTDCTWHEVRGGDSISGIAAQHDVDIELLMMVNRITEETILHPEDRLCIPEITYGGALPPTPGPSPTPGPTSVPPGPTLLYPRQNATIGSSENVVTLQWTAVKDLAQTEWYMVELTDLDEIDALPRRAFTRDTSFQLPIAWRPAEAASHRLRWRVSIVQVTGERSDGIKIYTFGGEPSTAGYFSWEGVKAEATATATTVP